MHFQSQLSNDHLSTLQLASQKTFPTFALSDVPHRHNRLDKGQQNFCLTLAKESFWALHSKHHSRDVLWCNTETSKIKIVTHACFDEVMNNLPVTNLPPNITHLRQHDDGNPIPVDVAELSTSHFNFDVVPFVAHNCLLIQLLVFSLTNNLIQERAFVTKIDPCSASYALCLSHKQLGKNCLDPV